MLSTLWYLKPPVKMPLFYLLCIHFFNGSENISSSTKYLDYFLILHNKSLGHRTGPLGRCGLESTGQLLEQNTCGAF